MSIVGGFYQGCYDHVVSGTEARDFGENVLNVFWHSTFVQIIKANLFSHVNCSRQSVQSVLSMVEPLQPGPDPFPLTFLNRLIELIKWFNLKQ